VILHLFSETNLNEHPEYLRPGDGRVKETLFWIGCKSAKMSFMGFLW